MTLDSLNTGKTAIIIKVKGRGAFRKRITEMGFIKGQLVTVVKNAPLKDPVEYNIMGYDISLRRSEASLIEVVAPDQNNQITKNYSTETKIEEQIISRVAKKGKKVNVAMVGNPNSGKTTIFNFATKSKERVGNYSGVTVDAKYGKFKLKGYSFNITDLPGTYSLTAYSPEELFVREHITEEIPDVVINVVDASNLERNLFLTTQLIDMDIKVVMALNMYDEFLAAGNTINHELLGKLTGVPVVPTIGSKNIGINDLFQKVIDVYEDNDRDIRHVHINYGAEIEQSVKIIQERINHKENLHLTDLISSRFLALKLLEKDADAKKRISELNNSDEINGVAHNEIKRLEDAMSEDSETLIADSKYGFVAGALRETITPAKSDRKKRSTNIDSVLTNQFLGFPFFFLFIFIMFQATFRLGEYPMEWIEQSIALISNFLSSVMREGSLKDLFINGIIGGVGGVIVFLPNILILFFFISLMEDTGYMARAAFIMDKLMHKIGLHGKSFIPLIMGFGCNVPAIMATRTIENRDNRLVTMLINPFMSCSARLPVYVLIIGAFFYEQAGLVLFGIYAFGILTAIVFALIFKKTLFKKEDVPFVMELPPYRVPTIKTTTRHMWHKGSQYVKKMGGIILIASIIIWALGYYPRPITQNIGTSTITTVHQDSYIKRIGLFIEPVIKPLGFDWKMGVALLSGVAAKEIVVSTMGVLYQADPESDTKDESLGEKLQQQVYEDGSSVFTTASALAFLVFILLYFPCVAVIAAIKNESGHWKWAAFMVIYTTGLAWFMSFLVFQTANLFI